MMDFNQIKELIKAVSDSTITEFEFEDDDASLVMKKKEIVKEVDKFVVREAVKEAIKDNATRPEVQVMMAPQMPPQMPPQMVAPQMVPQAAPQMAAPQTNVTVVPTAEAGTVMEVEHTEKCNVVKSPLVGTFYCSASPDAEPFVKVGDKVKKGQVLGIIEAMKLMNDIESDFDGEIVEIMVNNKDMVEFEQPLFKIK